MLPKYHIKYTEEALKGLHLPVETETEIIIGSIANDYCELTNEAYKFIEKIKPICKEIYSYREKRFFLEGIAEALDIGAFYKSHFGKLASMHAMAKEGGKSADDTKGEVASWFEFLNNVALGDITIVPNKKIASDNVQISGMLTGEDIEYEQIFDTDETRKIRYRALGMMLHLIQDAYTDSHCKRVKGEIVKFYYYNLSLKDIEAHHAGDKLLNVCKDTLLSECKNCVKSILDGKEYKYISVIKLSDNTQLSDYSYNVYADPVDKKYNYANLKGNTQLADVYISPIVNTTNHGSFSGNPKTEWLVDENGYDRNMVLIEDFWYVDPDGKKWVAPKGSVINGASIPQPLWSIVGSPYTGDYRRASIVHDVACNDLTVQREDADTMFYYACLAGGCSSLQAKILYAGVRIGAWVKATFVAESFAKEKMLFWIPFRLTSDEQFLQSKFQEITTELAVLGGKTSIAEFDVVINKHIKF